MLTKRQSISDKENSSTTTHATKKSRSSTLLVENENETEPHKFDVAMTENRLKSGGEVVNSPKKQANVFGDLSNKAKLIDRVEDLKTSEKSQVLVVSNDQTIQTSNAPEIQQKNQSDSSGLENSTSIISIFFSITSAWFKTKVFSIF